MNVERLLQVSPFLCIGILLLLSLIYFSVKRYRTFSQMSKSTGIIVATYKARNKGVTKSFNYVSAPIIKYEFRGESYKFKADVLCAIPIYKIGQEVPILLDEHSKKGNPKLASFFELWFGSLCAYSIALLFIWSSIAFLLEWENAFSQH